MSSGGAACTVPLIGYNGRERDDSFRQHPEITPPP